MSETTELKIASKESVAFDLTMRIATQESLSQDKSTYRKKVLDLYNECLVATGGYRDSDES